MRRAVIAAVLVACQNAAPAPSSARGAADHRGGAKTYATFCSPCHGEDATGYKADHAPSLVNPTFLESATDAFLIDAIEQGRPGTSMAAYARPIGGPLDSQAIRDVVGWLRGHGSAPHELATPTLAGDAIRGHVLYTSTCEKCHGNEQVRGQFVSLGNPRFLASASDAFMTYAIVHGRPGTQMLAWQDKLSAQDIADVIAYVRSLQRAVTVARLPPPTGDEPLFARPDAAPPHFVGRADPCPPSKPACKPDPRFVPADQVKAAMDAAYKFVIIDARNESDWMLVHINGAISVPYSNMKRLDEIPKDAWIVAYCACPHHLSGIVVDELQKRGYLHAFVLDEGINEWQRRGYPIVRPAGAAPMPPAEPPQP